MKNDLFFIINKSTNLKLKNICENICTKVTPVIQKAYRQTFCAKKLKGNGRNGRALDYLLSVSLERIILVTS